MKYILLMYAEEGAWSPEEHGPAIQESVAVCQELADKGKFVDAGPLHPVATATCVRVRDGKRLVSDGPYAETKEQLGGYFLVDVDNLDDALDVAAKVPGSRRGTAEIRPVMEPDNLPEPFEPAKQQRELFAYICVSDAAAAIDFYTKVFDATEVFRLAEPGGRIGHAEVDIDGNILMLCDEYPAFGIEAPQAEASASCTLHLHVENADAVVASAVEAGATLEREVQDEFYGERSGVIRDPFGHRWLIGHSIEQLTPEEMQRRWTELLSKQ